MRLTTNVDKLNGDIRELKADLAVINGQLNNEFVDASSNAPDWVRPYPESKLLVSRRRLHDAERSKTFTEFTLRSFTAFVSVEDVYRTNLEGGRSKVDKNAPRKKAIDKSILNEIYEAVYHRFKVQINAQIETAAKTKTSFNWKSKVNLMVQKKLQSIASHFRAIKAGETKNDDLKKEDKEDFRDYERYITDPNLFNDLDEKIDQQPDTPRLPIQAAPGEKDTSNNTSNGKNRSSPVDTNEKPISSKGKRKKYATSSSSSSTSSSSSDESIASSSTRTSREAEDDSEAEEIRSQSARKKKHLAKVAKMLSKLERNKKRSKNRRG